MDNKQNREFYWEVKDFMTSRNTQNPVSTPTPKSSIADQAKLILEKKQSFPQKPLEINNTIMNAACQVIGVHQKQEAGYNPQSKAFSKNSDVNSFRGINEGFWEDLKAGLEEVGNFGTNIIGKGQGAGSYGAMLPMTADEARQKASLRRAGQALNLNSRQLNLQQAANPGLVKQSDVTNLLSQKTTSGVSLLGDADRQKANDLFGNLVAQEFEDKNNTSTGSTSSLSGTPASSTLGKTPPLATAGVDTEGPPSSLSGSPTSTGAFGMSTPSFGGEVSDKTKGLLASMDAKKANANTSPTTPTATTSDSQKAERKARQDEINKKRNRQDLERKLVYYKTLHAETDYSRNKFNSAQHKARDAAHIKRLEQKLEDLG